MATSMSEMWHRCGIRTHQSLQKMELVVKSPWHGGGHVELILNLEGV